MKETAVDSMCRILPLTILIIISSCKEKRNLFTNNCFTSCSLAFIKVIFLLFIIYYYCYYYYNLLVVVFDLIELNELKGAFS